MKQETKKIQRLADEIAKLVIPHAERIRQGHVFEYLNLVTQIQNKLALHIREHGAIDLAPADDQQSARAKH